MAKCAGNANGLRPPLLLLLLASLGLSQQASIDDFYTAGVVEFRQANGTNGAANLADNLAGYLELIGQANETAADIIVFPEMTLNSLDTPSQVPAAELRVSPCVDDALAKSYAPFLVAISCAARAARKYVVINVNEQQLCSVTPEDTRPCAPTGYNVFNTNVVFDRRGTVVARYRKVHLYGESRNTTFVPEPVSFATDFNVTFGLIICFDILFYQPGQELILQRGVRDFIFTTMWFSELPFLTAVQVQQSWAYGNNVNLLAAGASRPEYGSSGSGIYRGREGSVASVMRLEAGERRLYVAQLPKYASKELPGQQQQQQLGHLEQQEQQHQQQQLGQVGSRRSIRIKRDYLKQYESVWLAELVEQQAAGNLTRDVCHGQLCCHFELEWRQPLAANGSNHGYRLGAYDGWRSEKQVDTNYVRNCGIFACSGPSIDDCGQLPDSGIRQRLSGLLIEAKYPKSRQFLLMPNSVLDNLLPLAPSQFQWTVLEPEQSHQLSVRFATADSLALSKLLTFAIYGNYYDDVCTFGAGTTEEDRECGFLPIGDGAARLQFSGIWFYSLLSLILVFKCTS